ncbi:MAG: M61 family peptidase [Vicinamibacterales bacterium]
MRSWPSRLLVALLAAAAVLGGTRLLPAVGDPAAAIEYRLAVVAPAEHRLDVEMVLPDLPPAPLELQMSVASPGRYALHDFVRGVSALEVTDTAGRALTVSGPAGRWTVAEHPSTVRVRYQVRGNRVDGTYLAVDATHAHVNMPAALVWARGLDRRAVRVTFQPPEAAGTDWRVATQLLPTASPLTFTAPNLQYLMDSPAEFSAFATRVFTVRDRERAATFRLALHDTGTPADADAYARDLEAIAGEATAVFGSLPVFESPEYTFIADFLPDASGDGMEHRNSTVLTSPATIAGARRPLAEKGAHEVFHAWNIERIRPKSLEPFAFDRTNVSGELWLGEGVTNYYGRLLLARAGIAPIGEVAAAFGEAIDQVVRSEARRRRSVVEMSRLAPLTDGAGPEARAGIEGGFLSYYTWGETIGLALDLTLRQRTRHAVSLDTLMQRLWEDFGARRGEPGYVVRPYEDADVEAALAQVSGSAEFARRFMDRYVRGREVPDFAALLAPAGFVLRDRRGTDRSARAEAPMLAVVPVERLGTLTPAQRAFREQWAGPRRTAGR